ncbi:MAG: SpoVR family protein [Oligoflexia bacterium]|nr:SpoVR family protein [Oligoflexia bacterium]
MRYLGLFLSIFIITQNSQGAGLFNSSCIETMRCMSGNCPAHSDIKIRHVASGQNADLMPKLENAVQHIYRDIAPKLGLRIPSTTITHLSAADMAALAMNAGHPAPHWIDGKKVLDGAKDASGILEFVTPGVKEHHQYVRDTNSFHESLVVLAHVAGHYDFAEVTPFFKQRDSNQVVASMELAKLMTKLRLEVDVAELSEWYHKLNTLGGLQDLSRGSYTAMDKFLPENNIGKTIPRSPTESILQAFAANLASDIAPWKKEMVIKFEKLHRSMGGYYQTKTMNEGWATMMEYLVLRHSQWRTSADATEFGQINAGVVVPRISNPYWLGLEAWNNLYKKFLQRPELKGLSEIEKDAQFIHYAHGIIKGHTDYTFIRLALDSRWIESKSLLLYKQEDIPWPPEEQKRVVSKDAERVVDYIANSTANRDLHVPKIELTELNYKKTGTVALKHNHVEAIPLNPRTLAQALYTLANVIEAKIKLETIAVETWNFFQTPRIKRVRDPWDPDGYYDIPDMTPSPFHYEKMTIEVSPTGEVKVEIDHADKTASEKAQNYFQAKVDVFKDDLNLTYEGRKSNDLPQMQTIAGAEIAVDTVNSLKQHAPTAAQAVLDYLNMIKTRMKRVLEMSVKGKSPVKFTGRGVQVKLLPEVPEIQLDFVTLEKRKEFLVTPDPYARLSALKIDFMPSKPSIIFTKESKPIKDEDLDIISGPGLPGDIIDRKPKQPGENGEGEPKDGEEDGEQPGGKKPGPGSDPKDPTYEEIPLDIYGQALAQAIELRNLRRTSGENEKNDDMLIGTERKAYGEVVADRTAIEAFAHGKALEIIERRKNKDKKPSTAFEILKNGFKHLPEEEQRVRSREPEPEPDFDAVVVFVADTSGSMGVEEKTIERMMVRNQVALLKSQYKNVKVHYVIYGGSAKEVSERDFYNVAMNDGTATVSGINLAAEILKKYPRNKYNRFVQVFSDGDDFNPSSAAAKAKQLASELEYFTYGAVHGRWRNQSGEQLGILSQEFARLEAEQPKLFGFAVLVKSQESIFEAIKKWFGKR